MRKVLLIQLLRLGDVLMTLETIKSLRREQPESRIVMLGCTLYAGPLGELLPVDELFLIDRPGLASLLMSDDRPVERAYEKLASLITRIRSERFDLVINLSHCEISALIAHLSGAKEAIGLIYDVKGSRRLKGSWAKYLFSLVKSRGYNALHMSDIYKRMAGVNRQTITQKGPVSLRISKEPEYAGGQKVIALQPGASIKAKMWPMKYFAALADMIMQGCGARVVIFGSVRERVLAEELCGLISGGAENLAGCTSLPDLARKLASCDLLLTNDTGTMHLAAAVGTRILSISLGPTRVFETGPRGEGHLILEPALPCMPCADEKVCPDWKCREAIAPEAVYLVARGMLVGKEEPAIFQNDAIKGINIYKAVIDESGDMAYVDLGYARIGFKKLLSLLYRKLWSAELNCPGAAEDILGWIEKYAKGALLQCHPSDLLRCSEVLQSLAALFSRGSELTGSILGLRGRHNLDVRQLATLTHKIEALDNEVLNFDPLTSPLKSMYEIEVLNIEAEDLFEIARQRHFIFQRYTKYSLMMGHLVNAMLSKINASLPVHLI